jgi:hypothetical protein
MSTNHKCDLDNTLRFIYSTFRNKKYTMAIEFKHRGQVWRADTVEEAIRLRRELEEEADADWVTEGEDSDPEAYTLWTPDVITEFLEKIGDLQYQFVRLLCENDALSSEEIVRKLKLDSEVSFAGVLSGLSKQLKHLNLTSSLLYTVTVSWDGKSKKRVFRVIRQFRFAASEMGWPDNWPMKKGGPMPPPPPAANSKTR